MLFVPPPSLNERPWAGVAVHERGQGESVVLHQFGFGVRGKLLLMVQSADQAALPDTTEWQQVEVAGRHAHGWSDRGAADVVLWRDGTGIWIRNAEDLGQAVALAESLEPVAPAPVTV